MNRFIKLTIVQFKLFFREPIAFFFTLVFPALLLLMFGAIWGNEPSSLYGGIYGYADSQVPGLTAIVLGTVGMVSIPIATATLREQKVLRRYKATPMPPMSYLAADIVVNFLLALIGLIILIVLGKILFDLRFGGNILAVFAGFTLSTLAFASIGYIYASVAPTSKVATVLGQLTFFPMMFLSGATLPLDIMPDGIRSLAEWLPLTHVVTLLRSLWFGNGWDMTATTVLGIMLVAGTLISARIFRWE